MLNLTPQRWKASAKVEQNLITTKHAHKLFYAKTKIIPEMTRFDMWKWQNQRKDDRKQAKKGKENSVRVRLFIAQNPRSPPQSTVCDDSKSARSEQKSEINLRSSA